MGANGSLGQHLVTMKLLDLLFILAGLAAMCWTFVHGHTAWTAVAALPLLIGLVLMFQERNVEISVPGIGTIKISGEALAEGVPTKTLSVLPERETHLWWHMSNIARQSQVMQVVGDFHFRNTSAEPVMLVKASLLFWDHRRFLPRRGRVEGIISVKHQHINFQSRYEIPPGARTTGLAQWRIQPPVRNPPQDLNARACFIDEFGNAHWTERLRWRYR